MIQKNISIRKAVQQIDKLSEKNDIYTLIFSDKDYLVYRSKPYIKIQELNIKIYFSQLYNYDVYTNDYELLIDFYIFHDLNENVVFNQQGNSLEISIYNFYPHLSKDYIKNSLLCDVIFLK